MNDELTECYDLLGLSPGASAEELKVAYRDLAKVWHPDRFLHDPRLQEKAQEKLKEINEAYDLLRSGKAKRQQPSWTHERPRPTTTPTPEQSRSVAVVQRIRWQLILAPVLIFAVVFFATYSSLLRPGSQEDQSQVPAIEPQAADPEQEQAGSSEKHPKNESLQAADRITAKSETEESVSASTSQASATPLRPMSTVTVVIDPYTGMIARPDCPLKSKATFAAGSEPHQQCNAVHEAPVPKDSRIKSVAKRLASPGKWFGDGTKSDAPNKPDPKSQDPKTP